jgi:hypothetical protein
MNKVSFRKIDVDGLGEISEEHFDKTRPEWAWHPLSMC